MRDASLTVAAGISGCRSRGTGQPMKDSIPTGTPLPRGATSMTVEEWARQQQERRLRFADEARGGRLKPPEAFGDEPAPRRRSGVSVPVSIRRSRAAGAMPSNGASREAAAAGDSRRRPRSSSPPEASGCGSGVCERWRRHSRSVRRTRQRLRGGDPTARRILLTFDRDRCTVGFSTGKLDLCALDPAPGESHADALVDDKPAVVVAEKLDPHALAIAANTRTSSDEAAARLRSHDEAGSWEAAELCG